MCDYVCVSVIVYMVLNFLESIFQNARLFTFDATSWLRWRHVPCQLGVQSVTLDPVPLWPLVMCVPRNVLIFVSKVFVPCVDEVVSTYITVRLRCLLEIHSLRIRSNLPMLQPLCGYRPYSIFI